MERYIHETSLDEDKIEVLNLNEEGDYQLITPVERRGYCRARAQFFYRSPKNFTGTL